MRVRVDPRGGPAGTLYDLATRHAPGQLYQDQQLCGLTEHDLRDIEFVLAQRRAGGKRCTETDGEHTCSVFPGHPVRADCEIGHQCRACTYRWFHSGRPEDQGDAACGTPTECG